MTITWENTPTISQITLPSGSSYYVKDAEARTKLEDAIGGLTGAMHYIGITTTALTDGATTSPIVIDNENVTPSIGDVAIYGTTGTDASAPKEFVWNGTKWQEFGSTGSLKSLAFKDNASASYTPAGSVSSSFTGTSLTSSGSYTPAGSVSQPSFTGTATTISGTMVPEGTVEISTGSGTANYTPEGTVSAGAFTGTTATIDVYGGSGTTTYTPAGTVEAPTISLESAGSTTTVNSITDVGTLPTLTTTVTNEVLTIDFSQGTLPTKGTDTTVKTGDASYEATAPAFTGTGTYLSASYTPAGSVGDGSFTGTGANLVAAFTGSNSSFTSDSYTPAGTVSQPSFTGTAATIDVSGTPEGSVSSTFTGTAATITVS